MWTKFWDLHSGGSTKQPPHEMIYIEAKEDKAILVFYNRFRNNPNDTACNCCGGKYTIKEYKTLEQATGFHRHCRWDDELKCWVEEPNDSLIKYGGKLEKLISLEDYRKQEDVLIVPKENIQPGEWKGEVPSPHFPDDDWID